MFSSRRQFESPSVRLPDLDVPRNGNRSVCASQQTCATTMPPRSIRVRRIDPDAPRIFAPSVGRVLNVDITSSGHKADPFAFYADLRANDPICRVKMPDGQVAFLVTRYADVVSVLKDERFAKDRFRALTPAQLKKMPWMPSIFKPLMKNMLDSDRPNHTRLRALVQKAFTPQRVESMRGRIQSLSETLLDQVQQHRRFDLIGDFALPLPATVIAEMLGVPVEDQHKFHRWSNTLISAYGTAWDSLKAIPAVWQFLRYVRALVAQRRQSPRDDMISALIEAQEEGDRLSEDELVAMIFLLLVAGHETTVNLIANGMLALLQHPLQLERLRKDPALIDLAVEELLRFAGPLETATERYVSEDVELSGTLIPRGSLVWAVLCSANRDHRQFPRADELDITRQPNRHLTFGLGIHFCPGAPLARLEARIAIQTLLARYPHLRLGSHPKSLVWRRGLILRGMKSLPVIC